MEDYTNLTKNFTRLYHEHGAGDPKLLFNSLESAVARRTPVANFLRLLLENNLGRLNSWLYWSKFSKLCAEYDIEITSNQINKYYDLTASKDPDMSDNPFPAVIQKMLMHLEPPKRLEDFL